MKYFVLVLIMIMISITSIVGAECGDNQIDINSAYMEELDEISGIGPVYAGRIVEGRPFESVDDLTIVSGIGEKTLEKIKDQGLACVKDDDVETARKESLEDVADSQMDNIEINNEDEIILDRKVEVISLNDVDIESEKSLIYVSKNGRIVDYLPYGFALFLIFIIGFLIWERF